MAVPLSGSVPLRMLFELQLQQALRMVQEITALSGTLWLRKAVSRFLSGAGCGSVTQGSPVNIF